MVGFDLVEWKIRGYEPTIFPEPVRSILFIFSTAASRLDWKLSDSRYPLSTTRILGIPQQDVKALRPLYLRMYSSIMQLIIAVEFRVLDSQSSLISGEGYVVRNFDHYNKMIEMIVESQAAADWGSSLLLIEMITGGATSLAHDRVFNELKERIERELYHRRLISIKIVQIPVKDLSSLVSDERDRRIQVYEDILKSSDIKLVITYPSLYSHKEKSMKVKAEDFVEVINQINDLILTLEEMAAYTGKEVSRRRQLTDLKRYGNIFIPSRVMKGSQELERCLKHGDIITFMDRDIPLSLDKAILLVHGHISDVSRAEKVFIERTQRENIVSATKENVYGSKSILLFPISKEIVWEILEEIRETENSLKQNSKTHSF
ncbi:MAG: hypothetical protein QXW41_08315 [Fervidicoccaceae archaeon]